MRNEYPSSVFYNIPNALLPTNYHSLFSQRPNLWTYPIDMIKAQQQLSICQRFHHVSKRICYCSTNSNLYTPTSSYSNEKQNDTLNSTTRSKMSKYRLKKKLERIKQKNKLLIFKFLLHKHKRLQRISKRKHLIKQQSDDKSMETTISASVNSGDQNNVCEGVINRLDLLIKAAHFVEYHDNHD